MDSPTCIIHLPDEPPDAAIIWLHGLGADAHDLEPISARLGLKTTRHLFPNAPRRAITINNGTTMRAWFDFTSLDFSKGENAEHIEESVQKIERLIDDQIDHGIPPERIVLAGFSQGGVIALLAGLRSRWPLGGIMALSTYLPAPFDPKPKHPLPVIQCHGLDDPVIPYSVALDTSHRLSALLGPLHEWRTYPMEHGVSDLEIEDLTRWIHNRLDNRSAA